MSFQNLTHNTEGNFPVKKATNNEQIFYCGNFKGELSSSTGIYSKFLYIAKIDVLSGVISIPSVRIVCGPECKNHCINLMKKYGQK